MSEEVSHLIADFQPAVPAMVAFPAVADFLTAEAVADFPEDLPADSPHPVKTLHIGENRKKIKIKKKKCMTKSQ